MTARTQRSDNSGEAHDRPLITMPFLKGPGYLYNLACVPEMAWGNGSRFRSVRQSPAPLEANDGGSPAAQTDRMFGHAFRTRRYRAQRKKEGPPVYWREI